jgi:NAD(P)-dependent dehydrogenase (short-subunit alcohol dehydrogenase family)
MQPLKPLQDQTIVITGASSGIGRATALAASEAGAGVVLAARDAEALSALERLIREHGGNALAVPTDVSVEAEVTDLAERAAGTFGGIDTWVNNAAVSVYGEAQQISINELRRVMDVNFFGAVYGARAALPHLEQQGRGALIFVGSALSDRAIPLQAAYCASKHAIKAYAEALRVELAHGGSEFQVTLVKPSSIDTPLFDQARTKIGYKPKPIAPVYAPKIAADAILHCAQHHERELVVGGGGKLLTTLEAFAGPVLDWYQERTAYSGQRSQEPKSEDAPNNLFEPLAGMGRVTGTFAGRSTSLYTSLRLRPQLMKAANLAAAAVLIGALVRKSATRVTRA